MDILKGSNLLVRFLLELCMLAAVGYWGFKTGSGGVMKVILGIGLPILIAVIWGMFVAPKAMYPLHGAAHLALGFVLLASGAFALFAAGRAELGGVYMISLVANQVLMILLKQ
jgi:hypothetical protein